MWMTVQIREGVKSSQCLSVCYTHALHPNSMVLVGPCGVILVSGGHSLSLDLSEKSDKE